MNVIATCILYCLSVIVCLPFQLERSIHNDVIADLTRYHHGNHMYNQSRNLTILIIIHKCYNYTYIVFVYVMVIAGPNILEKNHTCEVS